MQDLVLFFKRKCLLLFSIMLIVPLAGYTQASMLFCFSMDENTGEPDWPFTTISFAKDKTIKCVVQLSAPLEYGDYVTFKVSYRKTSADAFSEGSIYNLDIKPEWNWFYYSFTFKLIGDFRVQLLDSKGNPLAERLLHMVE